MVFGGEVDDAISFNGLAKCFLSMAAKMKCGVG